MGKTGAKEGAEGVPQAGMRMRQLSSASELSVSTIKFYMSKGLLPFPHKVKPNVAYYDEAFLRRLMIVKTMRSEGLSISSIKSILDKYPFEMVAEWEKFKSEAQEKDSYELEEEERLATLSDEERRTEAILDAAFRVFSMRGYHNATVDDIAQEAGVSKGTCYQYFSGKEEIFMACLERTLETLLAEAEAAGAGAPDALTRLGLKGLTFISKYRDLQFMFVGIISEVMGGNKKLQAAGRRHLQPGGRLPRRRHPVRHRRGHLPRHRPQDGLLRAHRHRRDRGQPLPRRGGVRRAPLLRLADGLHAARPLQITWQLPRRQGIRRRTCTPSCLTQYQQV